MLPAHGGALWLLLNSAPAHPRDLIESSIEMLLGVQL
jgi:hypothetical protein